MIFKKQNNGSGQMLNIKRNADNIIKTDNKTQLTFTLTGHIPGENINRIILYNMQIIIIDDAIEDEIIINEYPVDIAEKT